MMDETDGTISTVIGETVVINSMIDGDRHEIDLAMYEDDVYDYCLSFL